MSEAAAQRGFWRVRVDANGIQRRRKKRLEKTTTKKRLHSYRVEGLFYVKCQQHKYFVSLFVPFCKKTMGEKKKKREKGGKSLLFPMCVYSATAIMVSKRRPVNMQPCRSPL